VAGEGTCLSAGHPSFAVLTAVK